jgi:hypothetical protein
MAAAGQSVASSGKLVFHSVGNTGDEHGKQMDFAQRFSSSFRAARAAVAA